MTCLLSDNLNMSQTKFRIERTEEIFVYDNLLNAIMDQDGNPIGYKENKVLHPSIFEKYNSPNTIKIILGHACNYNCSYCLQKDVGDPSERAKNIFTKELIKKLKQHLDLSKLSRIELWGGETLLYWKDIVEIMSAIDNESITWYLPTNGTLLKDKHAEFFKQLKGKVTIGISHDGPGHESLRGPEFLHRKVDILKSFQKAGISFSFNVVISTSNYDLFKIDRYFQTFLQVNNFDTYVPLVFELGRTYETGACATENHVITKEQIPEYRSILKTYLKQHAIEYKKNTNGWEVGNLLPSGLFHFGNGVIPYTKSLYRPNENRHYSNCGTDNPHLITLDMNGNLRTCQNTSDEYIYGTIEHINKARMQNVDYEKDDFCKDCNVLRLCNQSCPIQLPFETFLINHTIENAHYNEIQLAAFEFLFDSPITKLN